MHKLNLYISCASFVVLWYMYPGPYYILYSFPLMAATQDADMADDDSGELAPSTSIPTATSATTVGATPTTSLGDEEEEEPKPKPGKKRCTSSAKKKKAAESNGASGDTADGGKQL